MGATCPAHFILLALVTLPVLGDPRVVSRDKNSPTVTHACRKRRLKWVATLLLGDINTEAWSAGMEVGRGANNPTL
jgi:hypothetical protein